MNEMNTADLMPPGQMFFTVRQLAKIWGTSDQHVYNLIEDGELACAPDLRRAGGLRAVIRVTRQSIQDFLKKRQDWRLSPQLSSHQVGAGHMRGKKFKKRDTEEAPQMS